MHRCFVPPELVHDSFIELPEGEARHLSQVLRLVVGDQVMALDGVGHRYQCVVAAIEKRRARLQIQQTESVPLQSGEVHLVQALLKNKALDQVLAKAVELGVSQLTLVDTQHSVAKISRAEQGRKAEGWRETLIEAAKQSGNPWLPRLQGPVSLREWLDGQPEAELKLVASLCPNSVHLRRITEAFTASQRRLPQTAVIVIGPEGDFSPSELDQLEAAGFRPITLGHTVLRAETAATVAAAVLRHEMSP
ncbi:MAG TPA: RsmE family RNA methyltransferase [Candidatus Limnocylindria bacterium]|nr:RsmE family RNA methyltransferase [Candidatus Limnocylindria bacterium]